jgi:hypothetical protein
MESPIKAVLNKVLDFDFSREERACGFPGCVRNGYFTIGERKSSGSKKMPRVHRRTRPRCLVSRLCIIRKGKEGGRGNCVSVRVRNEWAHTHKTATVNKKQNIL